MASKCLKPCLFSCLKAIFHRSVNDDVRLSGDKFYYSALVSNVSHFLQSVLGGKGN